MRNPMCRCPFRRSYQNTNLLKTCRLIHTEASPTLYSKNVWVLPMTVWTVKFFANSLYNDERRAWVKHVYLYLQAQDISVEERQAVASDTRLGLPSNVPQREVDEWTYNAYGTYLRTISWPRKVELILEHLALDSLAVNVCWSICPETVYCPLGISAIVAFADGFRYGMPTHFEIYSANGWDREATETMLRKWTEQRGETFIPLSKGLSENQDIIKSIEYYIAWEGTIRG